PHHPAHIHGPGLGRLGEGCGRRRQRRDRWRLRRRTDRRRGHRTDDSTGRARTARSRGTRPGAQPEPGSAEDRRGTSGRPRTGTGPTPLLPPRRDLPQPRRLDLAEHTAAGRRTAAHALPPRRPRGVRALRPHPARRARLSASQGARARGRHHRVQPDPAQLHRHRRRARGRALHPLVGRVTTPPLLSFLAIGAVLVAVIWILVMVVSHLGLRRGHQYRPWQNKMAGVLVVSLALIIGIPLGVGSVFARVQSSTVSSLFGDSTGESQNAEDLWADKPYINIFLMGRDNGDDREGTRPDTMLVASIDTKTGNAALISVPRNLAFPVFPEGSELAEEWPDGFRPSGDSSEDLINAVWQW